MSVVGLLVVCYRLSLSFMLEATECRVSVVEWPVVYGQLSLSVIAVGYRLSCVVCLVSNSDCQRQLSIKILIVGAQLWSKVMLALGP